MQRDLVERRGWLTRKDFLDGVALGQIMAGPLAAQVVMWLGFLRARVWGAFAAAAAFIAPSFLLVLAVAIAYSRCQGSGLAGQGTGRRGRRRHPADPGLVLHQDGGTDLRVGAGDRAVPTWSP